jgi:metal-responsive CopG/Arc/MetJ family transcriptional regulator
MKKKIVTFPNKMLDDLYEIAEFEERSFSDLIREASRRYVEQFKDKQNPKQLLPLGTINDTNKYLCTNAR